MRNLSRANGLAVGFVFLAAVICFASKQFVMPQVRDAQTYPAHDIHNDEKVTIAADPYDTSEKGAIFTQKYTDAGYLPIFVVVTNNGDEPVSVQSLRVELVTGNRTKILPASLDDLYRRFSKVKRRGDEPRTNPLPYPFPKKGPQAGTDRHASDEFHAAMFQAQAVEPHSSQAGFFFFDIDDGESRETDGRGSELLDAQAARNAAIAILPDVAREELPDGDRRTFMCKVRDESDNVIFIATLSLVAEWINRGVSAK